MPKLQIALDFTSLAEALGIARLVEEYCDIFEAGTPLIKSEGIKAVEILKKEFPQKEIFADMKTMDAGKIEVDLAQKAGASYVSVMAASSDTTIKSSIQNAKNTMIVFDLMGTNNKIQRAVELEKMGAQYIHVHSGLDEQQEGQSPYELLGDIAKNTSVKLTVAGGINKENISKLLKIARLEIIMGGGAVINADNPKEEAQILWNIKESSLK